MGIDVNTTIDLLNDLIAMLRDGQNGFRDAAEHVKDHDLKLLFMDLSTQRARFLGELQNEVERLGEPEPASVGSVPGAVHRGWMNLKAALTTKQDEAIFSECERGEQVAIESYGRALNHTMPHYIREILEDQVEQINKARSQIRQLRQRSHAG